jgi:hypothetical protein
MANAKQFAADKNMPDYKILISKCLEGGPIRNGSFLMQLLYDFDTA